MTNTMNAVHTASDATRRVREYNTKNYDGIKLFIRPEIKDMIKEAAAVRGISMTALILEAVNAHINNSCVGNI